VAVTGEPDDAVEEILSTPRVVHAHIRNTEAGCFIARIERSDSIQGSLLA
jgi:hypothetical protein